MAKPYHAKVLTMFERVMKEDNDVYKDIYRPDAERIVWFGPDCGKVQKPADALPFPRKGGPMKYYNRVQYFGDHVFAETHDAVYEENDDRVHPKLKGTSLPALVICKVDDEGFVTHFEEFLDPAFISTQKRGIPAPQDPPEKPRVYNAPGDAAKNKAMIQEVFDKTMRREDLGHIFTREAKVGQLFATTWKGEYQPIGFNKAGELKMGSQAKKPPDLSQYTNRRSVSGDGWAIELHTANIPFNPKLPDQKYACEVAVLLQVDPNEGKKFHLLQEYADPKTTKRGATQAEAHAKGLAKL